MINEPDLEMTPEQSQAVQDMEVLMGRQCRVNSIQGREVTGTLASVDGAGSVLLTNARVLPETFHSTLLDKVEKEARSRGEGKWMGTVLIPSKDVASMWVKEEDFI